MKTFTPLLNVSRNEGKMLIATSTRGMDLDHDDEGNTPEVTVMTCLPFVVKAPGSCCQQRLLPERLCRE